jgi:asparagine synthase (glutamine-hydrolysing)
VSGIFGIARPPGEQVFHHQLEPMADALKHRGPDGQAIETASAIGVGHSMLWTTPESQHEVLPRQHSESGLWITADARIDNREELLSLLGLSRLSQARGDSELIIHAYLRWGERCAEKLIGDFSFAIWNPETQSLYLARDHLGMKPLYYAEQNRALFFASSAMAIARLPEVTAAVYEPRVADFLLGEPEGLDRRCTFYRGIFRLPAGHCATYQHKQLTIKRYWNPEPLEEAQFSSDEQCYEAFSELYEQAVQARLRSAAPVASMLSGGLDSSTVSAIARDEYRRNGLDDLRTYSGVSNPGQDCSERLAVEAIIAAGGINPTLVCPGDMPAIAQSLQQSLTALEDPFDSGWDLLQAMYHSASSDGSRVILSGVDGELVMGGPEGYLGWILANGEWRTAWLEAQGFSQHYYTGSRSPLGLYAGALRSRAVPAWLRRWRRTFMEAREYRQLLADSVIDRGFAQRMGLGGRYGIYQQQRQGPFPSVQHWALYSLQLPHMQAALERYERLAAYFGMEVRHPLMDLRLVNFTLSLPLRQKVRNGWSKYLLRQLASRRLPAEVAWREGWSQIGWKFTASNLQHLAATGQLRREALATSLAGYVSRDAINAQFAGAGVGSFDDRLGLMPCLAMASWLDKQQ